MRRLALLTVFFYVCTFVAPQRAQASVALAVLGAAAVGTAMMSASIGTYYAQNGVLPEYVSSAAGAVASAADSVFQPAYLAVGPIALVTAANAFKSTDVYLGKPGFISAKIGDMVDFVKNSTAGLYTNFKSLISANSTTSTPTLPDGSTISLGSVINTPAGLKKVTSNFALIDFGGLNSRLTDKISASSGGATQIVYAVTSSPARTYIIAGNYLFYYSPYDNNPATGCSNLFRASLADTTDSPTMVPASTTTTDYPGIKNGLSAPPAALVKEIPNILKNMPSTLTEPKGQASAADSAPPAITQAEIDALLKANTAAVANAAAEAAAAVAAANHDDAAAQIAATQAALEAAKAAEAAAEAANQPEPEPDPEPSYPVPSTWYTKTCDLSNGLGSCIDYQQVLNASHAFQSTALYQFPNLILQCLGYVEGDGCEYPPKISVDLFTRFSNGPIKIDLSPFESVVKVMKFFFSILCLVGTGKATMTLFE